MVRQIIYDLYTDLARLASVVNLHVELLSEVLKMDLETNTKRSLELLSSLMHRSV